MGFMIMNRRVSLNESHSIKVYFQKILHSPLSIQDQQMWDSYLRFETKCLYCQVTDPLRTETELKRIKDSVRTAQ